MSKSTWDIAWKKGSSLKEVLAARTPYDTNKDIVTTLACTRRLGLLRQLAKVKGYKREAKIELRIASWIAKSHRDFEKELKTYPTIFQEWHKTLQTAKKVGIYSVSYPSRHAMSNNLGDNYVAIAGDGLFMFMFEILSLEGNGRFKIARNPSGKENQDSESFCSLSGKTFGDIMTGKQILKVLKTLYQCD